MPNATVLIAAETPTQPVRDGLERRIVQTSQLMTVVLDMNNGPWSAPDPMHSHPHEQVTYIAEGELIFFSEGDPPRHITAGDCFAVPSGVPHSVQLLSKRARLIDTFHPIREDFLQT